MNPPQRRKTLYLASAAGFVLCLLAACRPSIAGSSSNPQSGESQTTENMLDAGGHKLSVRLTGNGDPVVVIDVGFAGRRDEWEPIVREVGAVTTVMDFDRAGYGGSDPGPMPRTPAQASAELQRALQALSRKQSYVIVGHSLGALNALVFCVRYPDSVAGLILLDPPPGDFIRGARFQNLKEIADEQTRQLQEGARRARDRGNAREADYFSTLASEHEKMFTDGPSDVELIDGLGDIPLVVIGSGVANPAFGDSASAFQEFWVESNRKLASLSSRGRFVFAQESTHRIHEDARTLVTREILEMLKEVRQ